MHQHKSGWSTAIAILVLLVTSCSSGNYPLPDPKSPETRENEKQITAILEADDDIAGRDVSCRVRYLGSEDGAMFAWGICSGSHDHENEQMKTSVSTIFRIIDGRAERPRDDAYVEDVEAMFPPKLADDALNNPNRLKP